MSSGPGDKVEACIGARTSDPELQNEDLRASMQRYKSLLALSSDLFWELGPDLRITRVSGAREGDARLQVWPSDVGLLLWELPRTNLSTAQRRTLRDWLECRTAIFRIVQEALTNVVRHADASRVDIRAHRENGSITVIVQDDGQGIGPKGPHQPTSWGVMGMRERARHFGGELTVNSVAGCGVEVRLHLPLKATHAEQED